MTKNVGTTDRILRIIVGFGLIAFGLYSVSSFRWIGLTGPVLIATAIFRFCPAYWLLRIRTAMRPASTVIQ